MTLREMWERLRAWRRRADLERDLADDLEMHLDLLARDLEHEGMSPAEARAAARRKLGNVTSLRERSRDYWGFPAIDALVQDVRYALRGLRHAPGFTATVIITLALGIGANAAMFGVIDRLMFRPYPYLRAPETVHRVYLETTFQGTTNDNIDFPYLRYRDLERAGESMLDFVAQSEWRFAAGTGEAARVRKVAGVSASFWSLFDAPPVQGRYFGAAEDAEPDGARVAVMSNALWKSDFGEANVVGTTLKIGMLDYTIIGVTPPDFVGASAGGAPEFFVPITTIPANLGAWSRDSYLVDYRWDWTQVLVRRKPGVSVAAASAVLTEGYKRSRAAARVLNSRVLDDSLVKPVAIAGPVKQEAGPGAGLESRVLLWVTGVAGIVLLIACANVANLMFARVTRRRREITVRLALGVRRRRLVAQFLTEALVLALLGSLVGLLVAQWGGTAIRTLLLPDSSPFDLSRDGRTLAVALGCAVAAALLTAVGPALVATRGDLASALKSGTREGTYQRSRVRTVLLVVQGALSVVLLIGAGLFVQSLRNAQGVSLGYDPAPVLEVIPDFRGYEMDSASAVAMRERLLDDARAIPGVEAAARINSRLFRTNTNDLWVDGIDSVAALGRFNMQVTSPDYFRVMRTRILRGRGLLASDNAAAPRVGVVSESMAGALWPGREAIGSCFRMAEGDRSARESPCITVVGVAENAAQQDIGDDPRFMYYLPVAQHWPQEISTMYLRMNGDAAGSLERVRRAMTRAMPGDGFAVARPLQEVVDDRSRSWRLGATMFVAFGGLALIVAAVGLYGVISYNVAQRAHELGVRVALGARSRDAVRLIVGQGVRVALAGVLAGLALAVAAARWVQPLLFHQQANDPVLYALVGAGMLAVAIAASAIPALRAARADPSIALRSD